MNQKSGELHDSIIYNGMEIGLSSELSKIGISKFSSKAHVEYGGYKMRPEDKEMCHFFYIWDVGAKGFIAMSFPGNMTPESKIEKTIVDFKAPVKDDYQVMVVDWLGKNKYGFALYPGTGAKDVGIYFSDNSNSKSCATLLNTILPAGVSTVSDKPNLGYFGGDSDVPTSLILYFPLKERVLAVPFIGTISGAAIVTPR